MMETSGTINELATALAKAQGVMGGALKDSANPFFKSKYADLESVWNACRKALSDNGLAVVQTTSGIENGVTVTTMLVHSSGQWVRDTLPLYPKDVSPQGMGSAITYGRRYALAAIAGVYQTDDDGEAAHGRHTQSQAAAQPSIGAQLVASSFLAAYKAEEDRVSKVLKTHNLANSDADTYKEGWALLPSDVRRELKAIINPPKAAPETNMLANGRSA